MGVLLATSKEEESGLSVIVITTEEACVYTTVVQPDQVTLQS